MRTVEENLGLISKTLGPCAVMRSWTFMLPLKSEADRDALAHFQYIGIGDHTRPSRKTTGKASQHLKAGDSTIAAAVNGACHFLFRRQEQLLNNWVS